jgi:ATP-dependent DNA helicase RecQ
VKSTLSDSLQDHFGHNEFRPGQEEIVQATRDGRDVLGVMATGEGKSVCFQLPAVLQPDKPTLVVSPLIALMRDQAAQLTDLGISTGLLESTQTPAESDEQLGKLVRGKAKLFYVSPERLAIPGFAAIAALVPWAGVVVDEAHCASEWSHSFRPDYLQIARFLDSLSERPPVSAFTATAPQRVREDIVQYLEMEDPFIYIGDPNRPNLSYERINIQAGPAQHRTRKRLKLTEVHRLLSEHAPDSGDSVIIYCGTQKHTERVAEHLVKQGLSADYYHADRENEDRHRVEKAFLSGETKIIVATSAFGMGVHKQDVRLIVHYDVPGSVPAYVQESGRAGRDGEPAHCALLFDPYDTQRQRIHIETSPSYDDIRRLIQLIRMSSSNISEGHGDTLRGKAVLRKWVTGITGGPEMAWKDYERQREKLHISYRLMQAYGLLTRLEDGNYHIPEARSPELSEKMATLQRVLLNDRAIREAQLQLMIDYAEAIDPDQEFLHQLMR